MARTGRGPRHKLGLRLQPVTSPGISRISRQASQHIGSAPSSRAGIDSGPPCGQSPTCGSLQRGFIFARFQTQPAERLVAPGGTEHKPESSAFRAHKMISRPAQTVAKGKISHGIRRQEILLSMASFCGEDASLRGPFELLHALLCSCCTGRHAAYSWQSVACQRVQVGCGPSCGTGCRLWYFDGPGM